MPCVINVQDDTDVILDILGGIKQENLNRIWMHFWNCSFVAKCLILFEREVNDLGTNKQKKSPVLMALPLSNLVPPEYLQKSTVLWLLSVSFY